MRNKKYGSHPPRKLGTILVRGEGSAAGRRFADDVDGANAGRLPSGRRGTAERGKRSWDAAAALGRRMKDCFDGAVLFSLRRGGGTAILEENNRF